MSAELAIMFLYYTKINFFGVLENTFEQAMCLLCQSFVPLSYKLHSVAKIIHCNNTQILWHDASKHLTCIWAT